MAPKLTVPRAQKLSLLLIILAIGYFYIQVEYEFGWEKAKVDENAVQADWVTADLIDKFKNDFGLNEQAFRSNCPSTDSIKQWVSAKWNEYSIENHIFNDKKNNSDSTIIYGVHKSSFSDGKTAAIIGLTYDIEDINYACSSKSNYNKKINALSSISSFITISTGLSTVNWLSKDIIFILIERNNFNYKYQQNQLLQHKHYSYLLFESFVNNILPQYTSIVVGGLIIEIPLYCQSRILCINVAGPLGFQPNYDIVATSIVAFNRNHFTINVSPYFTKSFWNNNNEQGKLSVVNLEKAYNLRKSMIRSMAYQAIGKGNGYHSYLVKHQIDAVSIISFDYYNINANKYDEKNRKILNHYSQTQINTMFNMVKSIELFTRSMSNLIEIFHHATFNYIIISQSKFITMVKYSIPIGLIGLSPLIEAFAIYTNCYMQYFEKLLFSMITLSICILFGIYTYFVVLLVNIFYIDIFYLIVFAVFLIFIGIAVLIKLCMIWYLYKNNINGNMDMDNYNDYYASFITLLIIYAMFSQIWLPIALNFSIGLYFVTVTAAMLYIVRKRAKLEDIQDKTVIKQTKETAEVTEAKKCDNDDGDDDEEKDIEKKDEAKNTKKTVFIPYGVKFRLLRMILLIILPIVAIVGIMFIMDINLFSLMTNLKYDLLDEDIYNKHPGWIVFFFTVIPTYLGCWFLLGFS